MKNKILLAVFTMLASYSTAMERSLAATQENGVQKEDTEAQTEPTTETSAPAEIAEPSAAPGEEEPAAQTEESSENPEAAPAETETASENSEASEENKAADSGEIVSQDDVRAVTVSPPAPSTTTVANTSGFSTQDVRILSSMLRFNSQKVETLLATDDVFRASAVRALEERRKRKTAGKILTIFGATLFVGSDIAGAIIIVTTPGYPEVESFDRVWIGLGVFAAGVATGIPMLVSGIVLMVKKRSEERELIQNYRYLAFQSTMESGPAVNQFQERPVMRTSPPILNLAF